MRTICFLAFTVLLLLSPSIGSAHWWKKISHRLPDDLNFSGSASGKVYCKEYVYGEGRFRRFGRWHKSVVCRGSGDFCATTHDLEEEVPNGNLRLFAKTKKSTGSELSLGPIVLEGNDCIICIEFDGPLRVKSYHFASYFTGSGRAIVGGGGNEYVPEGIPVKVCGLIVRKFGKYYLSGKVSGAAKVPAETGLQQSVNGSKKYKFVSATFSAKGRSGGEPCISETQCDCIYDDLAPEFESCPEDVQLQCGDEIPPPAEVIASDNCDQQVEVDFTEDVQRGPCTSEGTITRTWTATDSSGNSNVCQQMITVVDTLPPVITCPVDLVDVAPADVQNLEVTGEATAEDNCGTPEITFEDVIDRPNSRVIRTWTATDACGNTGSCQQIIGVAVPNPA